ncbi:MULTISPECIES: ATP-binding cassette domain-containing protein [unclassified Rhizobium]|uniref:ABC transporter ATP-binding protein n=1 Tax=unclassified Rhizobium TaxID=2613769 RepID=UPI001AE775C9|nr:MULTISPECIES: ATP-binding cassette domain-containing protein [unclassified Rhizobium]MBP2463716.1 iron complex transport system ATP-binding protein [Rhizobium sp. PvP014]MBP2532237.1 iron complex transport system ATP-binding protein [Rhizobium sp. PvP099]
MVMIESAQDAPDTQKAFAVDGVTLVIDGNAILSDVSLDFPEGEVVALVGHNGSGKSSLLKILARQLTPTTGSVAYASRDVWRYHGHEFPRCVAYLPQDLGTGSDMTIRELVACGRYPWHGALGRFSAVDREKVEGAIAATHIDKFADRMVGTLSGGERQRAWIAMLIAQDARCLLLDEPTAALDIAHQIEVLSLVRRLARENGRSVVIVLHDINMATRFCDRIHALKGGRLVASGTPAQILVPELLYTIYGIKMEVISAPHLSHPLAYAC